MALTCFVVLYCQRSPVTTTVWPVVAVPFQVYFVGAGGEAEPASAVIGDYRLAGSSSTGCRMISFSTLPTDPLGVSIPRMLASVGARSFSATFLR